MEKNYYEAVLEIVKEVYDDCDICEYDLEDLAQELEESVFDDENELGDIFSIVTIFEEQQRETEEVEIEFGRACAVYSQILNLLPVNEENARRLYKSYLNYCDIDGFGLLMDEFDEWLTEEEKQTVLQIAKENFISCIWEPYV